MSELHREPVRDSGPGRLEWLARAWHEHFGHDELFGPWAECEANVCVEARGELAQATKSESPVSP